jgi:hypothetical protein
LSSARDLNLADTKAIQSLTAAFYFLFSFFFYFVLEKTNMSSLENWATDKLAIFLGFDTETIKTQVLPYLMSTESPDIFADRVMVKNKQIETHPLELLT